jgi:addiction module HigA family antidote
MTQKAPKRGLPPMHAGELLREEILPALARPKTEIAKLLGVSRQTLYDIIDEKQPVTATMALRLGKLCGTVPISGSICRSGTICTAPSSNWGTRSRPSRHWRSPDETPQGRGAQQGRKALFVDAAKTRALRIRRGTEPWARGHHAPSNNPGGGLLHRSDAFGVCRRRPGRRSRT